MTASLVRRAAADWPALAPVVHAWNQRPEGGVHCLHASNGPDLASHAAELAALQPGKAAFWAVQDGERLVGVFGCEFDPAIGRAWMRGPLAADPAVLASLLPLVDATVQSALPYITQFEAFPAADSATLNEWYAAAGYTPLQVHAALRAETSGWPEPSAAVGRAVAEDLPKVLGLHDALFPSTYLGEPAFRRALDAPDCALFVARGGDSVPLGYLYVEEHPADQEAYVHFLGVASSQRGRGLGRALLGAAARWGADRGLPHVALTVREDRPGARGLYQRAGFVEVSTGRHWRKTTGASAQPTKACTSISTFAPWYSTACTHERAGSAPAKCFAYSALKAAKSARSASQIVARTTCAIDGAALRPASRRCARAPPASAPATSPSTMLRLRVHRQHAGEEEEAAGAHGLRERHRQRRRIALDRALGAHAAAPAGALTAFAAAPGRCARRSSARPPR